MQPIDNVKHRMPEYSLDAVEPLKKPRYGPVGWNPKDTLEMLSQSQTPDPAKEAKKPTWGQWIRSFFISAPPEFQEVGQKEAVELVETRLNALMRQLSTDCPDMDMDDAMALIFYLSREVKAEELDGEKEALAQKYKKLQEHRTEYQRLTTELAQALKKGGWWQISQDITSVGSACLAASTFGIEWLMPVLCLAAFKLASSYDGNSFEHSLARVASKKGLVSEQVCYRLIESGVTSLFVLGAAFSGGADPTKVYTALKQIAMAAQMMTGVGSAYMNYSAEGTRADMGYLSTQIQEKQKIGAQGVAECSKGASQAASKMGNWLDQINRHKGAIWN